jgi:hypothetical protein
MIRPPLHIEMAAVAGTRIADDWALVDDRTHTGGAPGASNGDEVEVAPGGFGQGAQGAGSEVRMSSPAAARHINVTSIASGWPLRAAASEPPPRSPSIAATSIRRVAGPTGLADAAAVPNLQRHLP